MEMLYLYLMMQADRVLGALAVSFIVAVLGSAIFACAWGDGNEKANARMQRCATASVILLVILTIVPSSKTLAVMAAGHYGLQAVKSETSQKLLEYINKKLDEALKK